jgi:negative regulator of flagellin synthesis FlgM
MQIYGPGQVHTAQGINAPHNPQFRRAAEGVSRPASGDQLSISPAAEAAIQAATNDGIRADLVAKIRAELASGTYETAEKLDVALDRLLDEIG